MPQYIGHIALVVDDYDRAITYYQDILGFELMEDTVMSETKRWIVMKPSKSSECGILLAKASTTEQISRIGNQTGGRVFLFLYTDDFDQFYARLINANVKIVRQPSVEAYGKVAVFEDLYGNLWDLIEPV
ncbi:MAG: VOC family protein [Saprospiraceae bacterium]|nr:VOC family protein [Saprospiraceae bacterium]MBK6664776.1 VOC family protein [Saprospiraceae bacterium]MBK8826458.1 VOC family protein [Saprospiraceae bacterium]HQV65459.1 VOC family protein [Saprospiraceae bacterium]HQV97744.1 VOC family protein [Saprospiraceae bacterium]